MDKLVRKSGLAFPYIPKGNLVSDVGAIVSNMIVKAPFATVFIDPTDAASRLPAASAPLPSLVKIPLLHVQPSNVDQWAPPGRSWLDFPGVKDHGIVVGHVAFRNRIHRAFTRLEGGAEDEGIWRELLETPTGALVQWDSVHGYISPTSYTDILPDAVPTWDYVSAWALGPLVTLRDLGWKRAVVDALVQHFEGPSSSYSTANADESYLRQQLGSIVPFAMPLVQLVGKAKLSQSRTDGDLERIAERHDGEGQGELAEVTRRVRSEGGL